MRVRKYHRNTEKSFIEKPALDVKHETDSEEPTTEKTPKVLSAKASPKLNSRGPAALFRKIMKNPNLNVQLMIIVLTLASDNFPMDRGITSMSSTVDKIRNMTDVINNTMQSVKVATDAPKQIRRLFETREP
ncbi:hypothetical protein [Sporomusa sp. KB1]|jgi:hypothetical protein|uniref:hypothetical protein n=1 Tax=Sporomusa sp. KB1 TaxID=943346 RepID=UPI0011A556D3|nr:hypothetical protein [Sporomusa sp. KB1]TWH48868.1 hypothetical protein Salpa_5056 [Sporomusa sp. KB1]